MTARAPRILLLANDFPPNVGGVAAYLDTLYAGLPPESLTVVAPRRVPGHDVVPYRATGAFRGDSVRMALAAAWAIVTRRPAVVHCGTLVTAAPVALMCKLVFRRPFLVHLYGTELWASRSRLAALFVRQAVRRADRLVPISDFTRRRALALGGAPERTVTVLPPVDVSRFDPPSAPAGARRLVTVARLIPRKGHDVTLRAVAIAARTFPDLEYVVVGDGPHRPALEELAASLGVEERVTFAGEVDDVRPFLREASAFVLASRTTHDPPTVEGFGIAFCEAAAMGLPVIAGRSGGIPEAVVDGVTGVLVAPEDPEEIARAIVDLLGDPERARRLGRQGRDWVARTLDPGATQERMLAIARSMCGA